MVFMVERFGFRIGQLEVTPVMQARPLGSGARRLALPIRRPQGFGDCRGRAGHPTRLVPRAKGMGERDPKCRTQRSASGPSGDSWPEPSRRCLQEPLISDVAFDALLADKAFDNNWLRAELNDRGAIAVIPPNATRKEAIDCDFEMYKWRHLIESKRCFQATALSGSAVA